ncbi:ribonuclease H-like domain-containing protein, partial [Thermothelomyces heterothallicus CBS 202.75]|uniref:ribonuclease H-like domain-containing protein n=1 Tax=Thermothelomyces heterothallicus CBS 202.75 TaxID=1149848 RepID=UPI0037430E05
TTRKSTPAIPQTPEALEQLNSLVPSTEELRRAGYVVEKLSNHELEQKKRCITCGIRIAKATKTRSRQSQGQQGGLQPAVAQQSIVSSSDVAITSHDADSAPSPKVLHCKFHPGKVVLKAWTCCGKHVSEAPCSAKEGHDVVDDENQTIERRWQFDVTPPNKRPSHRLAVAIDCEMGTAFDDDSELIRLTLLDYFSGETLIDSLVYPDIPMKHFNTRWSGITRADMEASRRKRQCIRGRDAARRAVFQFVGHSTVVVGHSAQHDLSALRWIHHRVVDSFIVESARRKEIQLTAARERDEKGGDSAEGGAPVANEKRVQKGPGRMSLKALAMERLGRAIQVGNNGHDSMEDALAARDLVHAYIT